MTDAALCCNVFEHMFLEQLFSFSKCWFIFFNSQTIYAFVFKNSNKFKDLAGSSVRFSKAQWKQVNGSRLFSTGNKVFQNFKNHWDVKLSLIFVLIPNKTKSRREVGSIFYNWKFKSTVPWSFHIFFKLSLIGHLVFRFKEGWCRYSSKCLILAAIIIRSHNRSIPSRCHKNIHREYIKRVFLGRGLPRWSQGGGWL